MTNATWYLCRHCGSPNHFLRRLTNCYLRSSSCVTLIDLSHKPFMHDTSDVDRSFLYIICLDWIIIAHRCRRLIANTALFACRCAVELESTAWNGREHSSWRHGGGWWSFVSCQSHQPRCDGGPGPKAGPWCRSVPPVSFFNFLIYLIVRLAL